MNYDISGNPRLAARVILMDEKKRILFLLAKEPKTKKVFWVMPGGGLKKDERFEEAAVREVFEETGVSIRLGPWVWTRRHKHVWDGKHAEQYERYFVGWASDSFINGNKPDSYVIGCRWWTLAEIENSDDDFAPRKIRSLLPAILCDEFPEKPFDCGV